MAPHTTSEVDSSPAKSGSDDRKRKRDVLSCLDCRRRKLKCDRAFPVCGRCQKGGIASSCTYQAGPSTDNEQNGHQDDRNGLFELGAAAEKRQRISVNVPSRVDESWNLSGLHHPIVPPSTSPSLNQEDIIRKLETRLAELEKLVAQNESPRADATISRSLRDERRARKSETNFFKGKGFRTQLYGASNITSLLAHFPDVRAFMKEIHPCSALRKLQKEAVILETQWKAHQIKAPERIPDLLEMVPERSETDQFLQTYLSTFETAYHILHGPSFIIEYELFWRAPRNTRPGFVAVLLMLMATVRCMSPKNEMSFDGDGSSARKEAVSWIHACNAWLKQQSSKHRFMEMYQVMCLRIIAASTNLLKVKEAYVEAENLLAYFRSAGMHRDPSLLQGKCSPFDGEMRRRLWAVTAELELQAAINRGAPSSLSAIPIDCNIPLNIHDQEFAPDSSQLPVPKAESEYTSTSYLHNASKSLSLRVSLCSLINDPSHQMQHSEVLQYEHQITLALNSIPRWTSPQSTLASSLLALQLRQFLILIHTPFARKSDSSHARYSRLICFENAQAILDIHSQLLATNNFALPFLREDVSRAALSICHNTFLCTLESAHLFLTPLTTTVPTLLQSALTILEERGMRTGRGLQEYWYVSAMASLVNMRLDPSRSDFFKAEATGRLARLYERFIKGYEKGNWGALVEGESQGQEQGQRGGVQHGQEEGNMGGWYYDGAALGFTDAMGSVPVGSSDLFDASDWTLDNLWPMDQGLGSFA